MIGGISRDAAEDSTEDGGSESLTLSFRDEAIKIDCLERERLFEFDIHNPFYLPLVFDF